MTAATERFELGPCAAEFEAALAEARRTELVRRIWARDPAAWKADPAHQAIIGNALGWLTIAQSMISKVAELEALAADVRGRFASVLLLGMGGSSLAPEVAASVFGARPGFPRLAILDTTDPDQIGAAERGVELSRTLFLVSSKSGGTIESASLASYFHEKLARSGAPRPGESFVAITDAGTSLERLAREKGYRRVLTNPSDIGGRYSALSYFGLAPMAMIGVDVGALERRACAMTERCAERVEGRANPGLALGAALAAAARRGRDKLTLVLQPPIEALGSWLEQLVAESTGKEGRGIVPVDGEELAEPACYDADRIFVSLAVGDGTHPEAKLRALEAAGHPVVRLALADRLDLGAEFFRWEMATAVAGALLEIDPFDQPNVQESKDNTTRLIRLFEKTGRLNEPPPALVEGGLRLVAMTPGDGEPAGLAEEVRRHFDRARAGDYAALLAYLPRSPALDAPLARIRRLVRDRRRIATTLGYGPRFLHSTGQLHKGGADIGLFLQITASGRRDIDIPGARYSFGTLQRAQALGDFQALAARGRRILWLDLAAPLEPALASLTHLAEMR